MAAQSHRKYDLRRLFGSAHLLSKQLQNALKFSLISATACLYTTWHLAGLECERASAHLRHGRWKQSLVSFERACILVMLTDTLVDVVSQHSSHGPLIATRRRLLAAIEHWLEEAQRELPRVASYLCDLAIGDEKLNASIMRLRLFISPVN
jgi:hypothetical protein